MINTTPDIFCMVIIDFLAFFEKSKKFPIQYPASINGTPRPIEYISNRKIPWLREFSKEAKAKIEPRIGPMHGVQPKANPMPTTKGKEKLLEYLEI